VCQNAKTECYPFRNPQPVKLAEKRGDALRTPDGEYKSKIRQRILGYSKSNAMETFIRGGYSSAAIDASWGGGVKLDIGYGRWDS